MTLRPRKKYTTDRKSKNFYGSEDTYIPGKTKVEVNGDMKKLLKEHSKLKTH